MHRRGLIYSLLVLTWLSAASSSFGQQRAPRFTIGRSLPTKTNPVSPDVVTVWQRLGIPQGAERFRAFRDSRVNRDGLSPGKERKPPMLRLDDPAFLQDGAPDLLKVAAKMKIDQDLAPQKIKALMYICNVGCSCYNKQTAGLVEKALIEGMKDCSVSVRLAALNVVLSNAGSKCACQGQCQTCCSDGVIKALEEIAYKQDKRGCYLEPNAQVRSMAEQALNACPPLMVEPEPIKSDEEDEEDDQVDLSDTGDEDLSNEDDDGSADMNGPETEDRESNSRESSSRESKDRETDQTPPSPDEETNSRNRETGSKARKVPARQASLPMSFGTAWSDPKLKELNIRGVVRSIEKRESNVTVQMLRPLEIPVGSQLVVASDENNVSFGTVVHTKTGRATVRVEDYTVVNNLKNQKRIRLGMLE